MLSQLLSPIKSLFAHVNELSPQQARDFMDTHRADQYTLLDVRQPAEYARGHLPGAKLIPLPDLPDRLGELEPEKPTIAYCAAGGRSRAAAQLLSHRGFSQVHSLAGGMMAWEGVTAQGSPTQGLGLIRGGEPPSRLLAIAYGLEIGLRRFHLAAAELAQDPQAGELWRTLAKVEVRHADRVWELYLESSPPHADRARLESEAASEVMEGGEPVEKALARLEPGGMGALLALEAAMALETQALDLYLRLAAKAKDPAGKEALLELAEDEKGHLRALGSLPPGMLPLP